jgi:uncharacterized repeat protein (TIGR02543 family)
VAGTVVNLTALPGSIYAFVGWSGMATDTSISTSITMPASAASITATFIRCWKLTTSAATGGSLSAIIPSNSPDCAAGSYYAATVISVTATPDANYAFQAWSGAVTDTTAALTFTMPASAASLTATFILA